MKKRIRFFRLYFSYFILFSVMPILAHGAETTAQTSLESPATNNVTIDFKDADIRNVLRVISLKSGVNIVAGPDVDGLVTIRLMDVPWEKALDVILRTYGFDYEFDRSSQIIRVISQETREAEAQARAKILEAEAQAEKLDLAPFVTRVYRLNYSTKSQDASVYETGATYSGNATTGNQGGEGEGDADLPIIGIISSLLTNEGERRGSVSFDNRTNSLIVTDTEEVQAEVEKIVDQLDTKTRQVMIEAKIVEITTDDDENKGIEWTTRFTASASKIPTTFPFQRESSSAFLPEGDPGATDPGFPTTNQAAFPFAPSALAASTTSPLLYTFGTLDASEFSAVFELLNEQTDTRILSNPTLTTLDNQPANMLVGTIILLPSYERNAETGTLEVSGYNERQVGIRLRVTPHINDQDNIVLDLHPEISEIGADRTYGDITFPDITTREASTQVMVEDGHTIVIGGLIKNKTVDVLNKVPFLGDFPLLGKLLFTKTEKGEERTELIFFITVYIVDDVKNTAGVPQSSSFVNLSAYKEVMDIATDKK